MKSYQNHAQKWVTIDGERVKVDVVVLPLVNWLNSIPSVRTDYSCAGGNGTDCWLPYVTFYANQKEARKIEAKISRFVKRSATIERIELGVTYSTSFIKRYRLGFDDRQVLKHFSQFVDRSEQ